MPTLEVGSTAIPYRIVHSTRAKRKRIVVTPNDVQVVAPEGQGPDEIALFMHEKRRWVYDKREELEEHSVDHPFPRRFATGSKLLYRGRRLRLTVAPREPGELDEVSVEYKNGFHIRAPVSLRDTDRDHAIGRALTAWMKARLRDDASVFVSRHAPNLGVEAPSVRIKDQRHLWGSCGKDGVIHLNWHLIFTPKPVLEYVVVHELCHLRHRDHSAAFWRMVGSAVPDHAARREWLMRHARWNVV